ARYWLHACWLPLAPNGSVIGAPTKSVPSAGSHLSPRAVAGNTGCKCAKPALNSFGRAFTNGPDRPFASAPGRGSTINSSVTAVKGTTPPSAPSPPSGFEFCIAAGTTAFLTTNPFTPLLLLVANHPWFLRCENPVKTKWIFFKIRALPP